jgi:cellulose synthase/poly-beta-1,6-N-acetylglucosamine synthase-like glycosyltransferase
VEAILGLRVPAGWACELIVSDNGSSDGTVAMMEGVTSAKMAVHLLRTSRAGKSRALNAALAAAKGNILLFTDDDVVPSGDWIQGMCEPIKRGEADAVAGGIRMARGLRRPWMERAHTGWLAVAEAAERGVPCLIGANMAVARHVFEKIPRFDEEVGPGAIGHAEDTLFSVQVAEAGFRIVSAYGAEVEHHFLEERLTREGFVRQASKRGEFNAYVAHHWFHANWRLARMKMMREWVRLNWMRLRHWGSWWNHPAAPGWELGAMEGYYTFKHYIPERRRLRNYERHGLVKLSAKGGAAARNYEKQGLVKRSVLETK